MAGSVRQDAFISEPIRGEAVPSRCLICKTGDVNPNAGGSYVCDVCGQIYRVKGQADE